MEKITTFKDGHRFLSNFWPVKVEYEGITYPSTEHAYQAAKTLDFVTREEIRNLSTPAETKKFVRKKSFPKRPDWEEWEKIGKINVMYELLWKKFQHPELRQMLLLTGDKVLEEGNTWGDTFWGICKGEGKNMLGILLMNVRDKIRKGVK